MYTASAFAHVILFIFLKLLWSSINEYNPHLEEYCVLSLEFTSLLLNLISEHIKIQQGMVAYEVLFPFLNRIFISIYKNVQIVVSRMVFHIKINMLILTFYA